MADDNPYGLDNDPDTFLATEEQLPPPEEEAGEEQLAPPDVEGQGEMPVEPGSGEAPGAEGGALPTDYFQRPQQQRPQPAYPGHQPGTPADPIQVALHNEMYRLNQLQRIAIGNPLMYTNGRPSAALQGTLRQIYHNAGALAQKSLELRGMMGMQQQPEYSPQQKQRLAQINQAEMNLNTLMQTGTIYADNYQQLKQQIDAARQAVGPPRQVQQQVPTAQMMWQQHGHTLDDGTRLYVDPQGHPHFHAAQKTQGPTYADFRKARESGLSERDALAEVQRFYQATHQQQTGGQFPQAQQAVQANMQQETNHRFDSLVNAQMARGVAPQDAVNYARQALGSAVPQQQTTLSPKQQQQEHQRQKEARDLYLKVEKQLTRKVGEDNHLEPPSPEEVRGHIINNIPGGKELLYPPQQGQQQAAPVQQQAPQAAATQQAPPQPGFAARFADEAHKTYLGARQWFGVDQPAQAAAQPAPQRSPGVGQMPALDKIITDNFNSNAGTPEAKLAAAALTARSIIASHGRDIRAYSPQTRQAYVEALKVLKTKDPGIKIPAELQ